MKLNKNLIIISSCLVLFTFILSLILTYSFHTPFEEHTISFWVNVLLAIFGSSVVMLFTSVWGYFSERKKYELQYAAFARDYLLRCVRFIDLYGSKQSDSHNLCLSAGNLHAVYDSYAFRENYEVYGYILKCGRKHIHMRKVQNRIDDLAQEISKIEKIARDDYQKGNSQTYFKTSINIDSITSAMNEIEKLFSI